MNEEINYYGLLKANLESASLPVSSEELIGRRFRFCAKLDQESAAMIQGTVTGLEVVTDTGLFLYVSVPRLFHAPLICIKWNWADMCWRALTEIVTPTGAQARNIAGELVLLPMR